MGAKGSTLSCLPEGSLPCAGVPHPDEKKGKLVRQPTPMPNVLKSAEKK